MIVILRKLKSKISGHHKKKKKCYALIWCLGILKVDTPERFLIDTISTYFNPSSFVSGARVFNAKKAFHPPKRSEMLIEIHPHVYRFNPPIKLNIWSRLILF